MLVGVLTFHLNFITFHLARPGSFQGSEPFAKAVMIRAGFDGWIHIVSYWYQAEKEALLYYVYVI